MNRVTKKHWKCNKRLKGCHTYWKWTAVSGVKTFIFEFRTMKNHWKDIHIDNSTNLKKQPRKGVFLALKIPRVVNQSFYQGLRYAFYIGSHCLHVLTKFQKNRMDWSKVMNQKVFGLFGAFWGGFNPFWAPGAGGTGTKKRHLCQVGTWLKFCFAE